MGFFSNMGVAGVADLENYIKERKWSISELDNDNPYWHGYDFSDSWWSVAGFAGMNVKEDWSIKYANNILELSISVVINKQKIYYKEDISEYIGKFLQAMNNKEAITFDPCKELDFESRRINLSPEFTISHKKEIDTSSQVSLDSWIKSVCGERESIKLRKQDDILYKKTTVWANKDPWELDNDRVAKDQMRMRSRYLNRKR